MNRLVRLFAGVAAILTSAAVVAADIDWSKVDQAINVYATSTGDIDPPITIGTGADENIISTVQRGVYFNADPAADSDAFAITGTDFHDELRGSEGAR